MTKILIVEDEAELASALRSSLEELGFEVTGSVPSCSAALESLWNDRPDLALVDTQLGNETCEAVLDECSSLGIPVIVTNPGPVIPDYCVDMSVVSKPIQLDTLQVAMLAIG